MCESKLFCLFCSQSSPRIERKSFEKSSWRPSVLELLCQVDPITPRELQDKKSSNSKILPAISEKENSFKFNSKKKSIIERNCNFASASYTTSKRCEYISDRSQFPQLMYTSINIHQEYVLLYAVLEKIFLTLGKQQNIAENPFSFARSWV